MILTNILFKLNYKRDIYYLIYNQSLLFFTTKGKQNDNNICIVKLLF